MIKPNPSIKENHLTNPSGLDCPLYSRAENIGMWKAKYENKLSEIYLQALDSACPKLLVLCPFWYLSIIKMQVASVALYYSICTALIKQMQNGGKLLLQPRNFTQNLHSKCN